MNSHEHRVGVVRGATRAERNMLRATTGDFGKTDLATLVTLRKILVDAS